MKRFLILFLAIPLMGCPSNTATPTQPLAPGYQNQTDQTLGETLAAAHRFYLSVQSQSAAGTLVLTPTEKTAFNDFGISLNVADAAYLTYHQTPTAANLVAAQNAVATVQSKQSALPTPGGN